MKYLFFLFILTTFISCCVDKDELKDAFSCTIANEVLYPPNPAALEVTYSYTPDREDNHFGISVSNKSIRISSKRHKYVTIIIPLERDSIKEQTYLLNGSFFSKDSAYASCFFESTEGKITDIERSAYETSHKTSGHITITDLDTISKEFIKVKGTFQFDAFNIFDEKIEVRNGRFNTKFIHLNP